ncbi:hypothetical protein [Amycolatopsis rubida]|uniref:Uncharacterized protein n=1 Tax=Amycolatopsis rubida TaxID=112413 RepID=A0A1I5KUI1_9PSEU|nr:hypothetical protein [Amycolatopsis rubida]SFO88667.1 hypothetical protein SAMN05421854_103341 [Amycolatopsis rubida]
MATSEEIELRVESEDSARSAKRSVAAKRIGELAERRAAIAGELDDVERELGEVLVDSSAVIEIGELARFTDVDAADLTRWRENQLKSQKTGRAKRKKPTRASGPSGAPQQKPAALRAPSTDKAVVPEESPRVRDAAAKTPAGVS